MWFFVVSVGGLGLAAYFLARQFTHKTTFSGPNPVQKAASEAPSPDYVLEDLSARRSSTIEFEVHPLSRFKMLEQTFGEYLNRAREKHQDETEATEFHQRGLKVQGHIQQFEPEPVMERVREFESLQSSLFLSLEVEVATVVEETVQLVNQLPSAPALLPMIEGKVGKLCSFSQDIAVLADEWKKAEGIGYQLEQGQSMILNKIQLLSDEELLQSEIKDFVNLYFVLRSFELFEGFNHERVDEIERHIGFLSVILSRSRTQLSELDAREIQRIQRNILTLLRSIHDFYKKYYDGLLMMLEHFDESRLKELRQVQSELSQSFRRIERDLLPVCEQFSHRGGSLEVEYNKCFQKVCGSHAREGMRRAPVGAVAAENIHTFLKTRLLNIRDLMQSDVRTTLKTPMETVYSQICSLDGTEE